jgi:hypothetical protein
VIGWVVRFDYHSMIIAVFIFFNSYLLSSSIFLYFESMSLCTVTMESTSFGIEAQPQSRMRLFAELQMRPQWQPLLASHGLQTPG